MTQFDEISEIYFWYFILILAVLAIIAYFIPSIIGLKRKIRNKEILVIVNLLCGWTCAGWILCLIWSITEQTTSVKKIEEDKYTEIIKLQELKDINRRRIC